MLLSHLPQPHHLPRGPPLVGCMLYSIDSVIQCCCLTSPSLTISPEDPRLAGCMLYSIDSVIQCCCLTSPSLTISPEDPRWLGVCYTVLTVLCCCFTVLLFHLPQPHHLPRGPPLAGCMLYSIDSVIQCCCLTSPSLTISPEDPRWLGVCYTVLTVLSHLPQPHHLPRGPPLGRGVVGVLCVHLGHGVRRMSSASTLPPGNTMWVYLYI